MSDLLERVAATGLLEPARPVVVLVSGGRDSVCLLDVAVRCRGADAVRALHVNYGLREAADADEAHCVALGERLGVPLDVHRAARPDGAGNLQAWARDVRYGAARAAVAAAARVAAGHTATDQAETILYRLAASPGRRALLGMRGARRAPRAAAARDHARGDRGVVPRARPRMARGRHERDATVTRAGACGATSCRRCARCTRRPSATSCAPPACCATRPRSSTSSSTPRSPGRDRIAVALRGAARARSRGWSCGASPSGRPAPRSGPGRSTTSWRSASGALDLGDGARAVVDGGVLRCERTPRLRPALRRLRPHARPGHRRDPRPARRAQAARPRSSARTSRGSTRNATCCSSACSRARCSSWPT